jgi:hypothetical protein
MNITLTTVPVGLSVLLNGTARTTPYTQQSVVGITHTIGVTSPQSSDRTYEFVSWSDNGTQSHTVNAPATNTTYTATFRDITASPSPGPTLLGDTNNDGTVDIFDYNNVLRDYGKTGTGLVGDTNDDGSCDIFDYNNVLRDYGKSI